MYSRVSLQRSCRHVLSSVMESKLFLGTRTNPRPWSECRSGSFITRNQTHKKPIDQGQFRWVIDVQKLAQQPRWKMLDKWTPKCLRRADRRSAALSCWKRLALSFWSWASPAPALFIGTARLVLRASRIISSLRMRKAVGTMVRLWLGIRKDHPGLSKWISGKSLFSSWTGCMGGSSWNLTNG